MADRSRPPGTDTRRVYKAGAGKARGARSGTGGGADSERASAGMYTGSRRRTAQPARGRGGHGLFVRILLALLVVLAVGAVAFLIGYLIGLKIALVALPLP